MTGVYGSKFINLGTTAIYYHVKNIIDTGDKLEQKG